MDGPAGRQPWSTERSRVEGLELRLRVKALVLRVKGLGFGVKGSGFRVEGFYK